MRPYRVAPNIVTTPILHAIAITSTGLAVTIAAWLAWVLWRNKRAAAHQPFARALHELRAVSSDEPRAWQILHRAFDRVAGRVIQTATLPTLFERAPQLAPARPQIEAFFTQSNSLFFANGHSPLPSGDAPSNTASPHATPNNHSTPLNPLTLCLHLRHIAFATSAPTQSQSPSTSSNTPSWPPSTPRPFAAARTRASAC